MPDVLSGQPCPVCGEKTLELREYNQDIPYFGEVFILSMSCSNCGFRKSDIVAAEMKEPMEHTIEVDCEEDMKIRIVRSSHATIKIPHIVTIEPGPGAEGYVSNIEGLLTRIRDKINSTRENEEDDQVKKKAKKLVKKLNKVMLGQEKLKITIKDPSGNSAIISDKVVVKKLR